MTDPERTATEPPTFNTADPLFNVVQSRLARVRSDIKEDFRGLLGKPIPQGSDFIIATRHFDILTFVNHFLNRRLLLDEPDDIITDPPAGADRRYFFVTSLRVPFWTGYIPNHLIEQTFDQEVTDHMDRKSPVAFRAAFLRIIIPALKSGWLKRAKGTLPKYERLPINDKGIVNLEMSDNTAARVFIDYLRVDCKEVIQKQVSIPDLIKHSQQLGRHAIASLIHMIKRGVNPEEVLRFALQAATERSGVLVGFNQNVAQRATILQTPNILMSGEAAISPPGGWIGLANHPIAAIEADGLYEQRILQLLGLV